MPLERNSRKQSVEGESSVWCLWVPRQLVSANVYRKSEGPGEAPDELLTI